MANRKDIALLDNELLIDPDSGDFLLADSDQQHIQDTINAFPGWWKEFPAEGVGVIAYLNSTGKEQQLARAIKIHLQADGYKVGSPTASLDSSGNLLINPDATIS